MWAMILIDTQLPPTMAKATVVEVGSEHVQHSDSQIKEASLLLKSQYSEKRVKKRPTQRPMLSPGSNYGSQASGSRGVVVIFTGEGVVDGHDSDW